MGIIIIMAAGSWSGDERTSSDRGFQEGNGFNEQQRYHIPIIINFWTLSNELEDQHISFSDLDHFRMANLVSTSANQMETKRPKWLTTHVTEDFLGRHVQLIVKNLGCQRLGGVFCR
jgi:hypothetical protein